MMIINASVDPSLFFVERANGLCPSTTYEFSAYVLNLLMTSPDSARLSEPNIAFSIETTSGTVLASDTTGNIPNTPAGTLYWKKCFVNFTTPGNVTDVVVKMTNLAPGGNGNDLVLDDITFRACGPIIQTGVGSVSGANAETFCQGTAANYTLKANAIGDNNPVYQWQTNYNGAGWNDMPGSERDTLQLNFVSTNSPGVYQYRMGVANGSIITDAACRVYSQPITITINPLPVVPTMQDQTVCEGYPLQLTATGGASYVWTGPGIAPTSQNPLVINSATNANAGTYTVVATSAAGCSGPPVKAFVNVVPKVVATVTPDVPICAGESTRLVAGGGLFYRWEPTTGLDHPDMPDPLASPLQTTTYTVHVSNNGCSDSSKSVTVTVNENPVANAGDNKTVFEGQSVKLDGSSKGDNITSYIWTPATFLDNPQSLTPVATPTDNITYTLTVVSSSCGTTTSQVFVRVYKKITIPNTFSPNNDGVNDVWNIKELFTYPDCALMVYNRYGQQVFQSTGYTNPWDGTYKGSPLPAGTYYYILDLKNNTPKISGWVLIVR
jgi:gliding motility-associated-like protein